MVLTGLAPAAQPLQRSAATRRYLLLGAGAAVAAYAAYRLYHSEAAAQGRRQLTRLRVALAAYADAFGTGAETLQMLLADLQRFLQSDRQEVPPSLRQLARLLQSREVADTTSATVAALIRGVTGATSTPAATADGAAAPVPAAAASGSKKGALDSILEALLSDRGHSLVSVAVSLGARNLVTAYCEAQHRLAAADRAAAAAAGGGGGAAGEGDLTGRLLDFLASPRGQQLAVLTVTAFVSNGMRAYLDQTLDVNFYEDLFAAMAKPEHLEAVKACVGVFARDVVGAYLAGPTPQQQDQQQMAPEAPRPQLRLSASIHELLSSVGTTRQQQQQQAEDTSAATAAGAAPEEPGSPCGSSVSGIWQQQAEQQQQQQEVVLVGAAAAASDVDSDILLHSEAAIAAAAKYGGGGGGGGGRDSARSHDGPWEVRTPQAAVECPSNVPTPAAAAAAAVSAPVLRQLQRVRQQEAVPPGMQRTSSGNLEWISAVSKEWLNVAQHPHGRTVMVELAGTAAKEAARGVSAALADRFRMESLVLVAFAMLLMAWLLQHLLRVMLG